MATAKQNETFADTLATVLHQDAEYTVYRLGGADGEVVQTVYPVFPGIEIVYHDVHATVCAMPRAQAPGCLEIHHCREGRMWMLMRSRRARMSSRPAASGTHFCS